MTVQKTTGTGTTKFQNQEFFNGFNWSLFEIGDIVWLEDYRGEVDRVAGVFVGMIENSPVIRLVPNRDGVRLAKKVGLENLNELNGFGYWKKYLNWGG